MQTTYRRSFPEKVSKVLEVWRFGGLEVWRIYAEAGDCTHRRGYSIRKYLIDYSQ